MSDIKKNCYDLNVNSINMFSNQIRRTWSSEYCKFSRYWKIWKSNTLNIIENGWWKSKFNSRSNSRLVLFLSILLPLIFDMLKRRQYSLNITADFKKQHVIFNALDSRLSRLISTKRKQNKKKSVEVYLDRSRSSDISSPLLVLHFSDRFKSASSLAFLFPLPFPAAVISGRSYSGM